MLDINTRIAVSQADTKHARRVIMRDAMAALRPVGYTSYYDHYEDEAVIMSRFTGAQRYHRVRPALRGFAIAKDYGFQQGHVVKYRYSHYLVLETAGERSQYIKVRAVVIDSDTYAGVTRPDYPSVWIFAHRAVFVSDSIIEAWGEYKVQMARAEQRHENMIEVQKAQNNTRQLSRNTITKALVHAESNGYCNETVIALTGAGHRMPTMGLTLQVTSTVTLSLDGADDYYAWRALAGACQGNWSNLVGMSASELSTSRSDFDLDEAIATAVSEGSSCVIDYGDITDISIDWQDPAIRPTED